MVCLFGLSHLGGRSLGAAALIWDLCCMHNYYNNNLNKLNKLYFDDEKSDPVCLNILKRSLSDISIASHTQGKCVCVRGFI